MVQAVNHGLFICICYNLPKVSLFHNGTEKRNFRYSVLFVRRQGAVPGPTNGRVFILLASLHRGADVGGPGSAKRCAGLASGRTCLSASRPPVASPCDVQHAAAMITREPWAANVGCALERCQQYKKYPAVCWSWNGALSTDKQNRETEVPFLCSVMEQRNFRQIIIDTDKKAVIYSLDHECAKVHLLRGSVGSTEWIKFI